MERVNIISQLLNLEDMHPNNTDLLKKIIVTTYLGRLRINGLSPDEKISVCDYLFDNERIIFDYVRLSEQKREEFNKWLLAPHEFNKIFSTKSEVTINEYRNYTAEVALNGWGKIKRFFGIGETQYWKIAEQTLHMEYQLLGIKIVQGKDGIVIGFEQAFVPDSSPKYCASNYQSKVVKGNTKRLIVTDSLVDKLINMKLSGTNFHQILSSGHPQAIPVLDYSKRFKDMSEYRITQQFDRKKPWYMRLWNWIKSWFISDTAPTKKENINNPSSNTLKNPDTPVNMDWKRQTSIYQTDSVEILQRTDTQEIIVIEKKPDIQNIVICGGGPKIFSLVGVVEKLNEAKIRLNRFAGTSAGGIMALFAYLDCKHDEIDNIFSLLNLNHIFYPEFHTAGASDSKSLKTALDYAVATKLKKVVELYEVEYPKGPITFAALEKIRLDCAAKNKDCGFGKELIIAATNLRDSAPIYFSLGLTPNYEVTKAVTISSSVPLFFRPTVIDGVPHADGFLTDNLPVKYFKDTGSTLIESETANDLTLLLVQFNTGLESEIRDKAIDNVYRENPVMNFIYGWMGGVKDPVSAWEQDRLKILRYLPQLVLINMEGINSAFDVSLSVREQMRKNGYNATNAYLEARYTKNEDGTCSNDELMYSTFNCMGDLLSYCCYRGNLDWFNTLSGLIEKSSWANKSELMKKAMTLRTLYFSDKTQNLALIEPSNNRAITLFGNKVSKSYHSPITEQYPDSLLVIYPLFLKCSADYVKSREDQYFFNKAHHSMSIETPFECLKFFAAINGNRHILLQMLIKLIEEFQSNASPVIKEQFLALETFIDDKKVILAPELFGKWHLNSLQCLRIFNLLKEEKIFNAALVATLLNNSSDSQLDSQSNEDLCSQQTPSFYKLLLQSFSRGLKDKNDVALVEVALASENIGTKLAMLECLSKVKGDRHILIHCLSNELKEQEFDDTKVPEGLIDVMNRFCSHEPLFSRPELYGKWKYDYTTSKNILINLRGMKIDDAVAFCDRIRIKTDKPKEVMTVSTEILRRNYNV